MDAVDKLFPLATPDPLFLHVPLGLTVAFWLVWWLPLTVAAHREANKPFGTAM
jgi:hypothetical protein